MQRNLLFIASCFLLSGISCASPTNDQNDCEKWLIDTHKIIDSLPMRNRHKTIIERVAIGCTTISSEFRSAAKDSIASGNVSNNVLFQAAKPYFSESCFIIKPDLSANKLPNTTICIGSDYSKENYADMLHDIDAATYLFGKSLQKILNAAKLDKRKVKRLIANFFLSNAIIRERQAGTQN